MGNMGVALSEYAEKMEWLDRRQRVVSEIDLSNTTDAKAWAQQFMEIFGKDLSKIDEGTMISWFANAIETGRTAGINYGGS